MIEGPALQKEEFVHAVYKVLYDHPDWFIDVVAASQNALIDYAEEMNSRRADAEGALIMAYRYVGKKRVVPKYAMDLINERTLKASEGTEFGRQLREDLGVPK